MIISCCFICEIPITDDFIYNDIFYNRMIENIGSYSENTIKIVTEVKENCGSGKGNWLNDGVLVVINENGCRYHDIEYKNDRLHFVEDDKKFDSDMIRLIFSNEIMLFHKRCYRAVEKYMEHKGSHISLHTSFFTKRKHGVDWDIQRGLYSEAKRHNSIFRLYDPKFSVKNRKFIYDILKKL